MSDFRYPGGGGPGLGSAGPPQKKKRKTSQSIAVPMNHPMYGGNMQMMNPGETGFGGGPPFDSMGHMGGPGMMNSRGQMMGTNGPMGMQHGNMIGGHMMGHDGMGPGGHMGMHVGQIVMGPNGPMRLGPNGPMPLGPNAHLEMMHGGSMGMGSGPNSMGYGGGPMGPNGGMDPRQQMAPRIVMGPNGPIQMPMGGPVPGGPMSPMSSHGQRGPDSPHGSAPGTPQGGNCSLGPASHPGSLLNDPGQPPGGYSGPSPAYVSAPSPVHAGYGAGAPSPSPVHSAYGVPSPAHSGYGGRQSPPTQPGIGGPNPNIRGGPSPALSSQGHSMGGPSPAHSSFGGPSPAHPSMGGPSPAHPGIGGPRSPVQMNALNMGGSPGMGGVHPSMGGPPGMGGGPPGMGGRDTIYPPDQPMIFNSQNPSAPPIYPCGICRKEVHENDQAILCESGCNFWFHRVCTGLAEAAFHFLTQEIYAEWVCDNCFNSKNVPLVKFKS